MRRFINPIVVKNSSISGYSTKEKGQEEDEKLRTPEEHAPGTPSPSSARTPFTGHPK